MPRSRLSARLRAIALRLALGASVAAFAVTVPDAIRTLAQPGDREWTLLVPLALALPVCAWRFGAAWWGGVAWALGLCALSVTARFQAWCMGTGADLHGSWWPALVLCGFTFLCCGAFDHAAHERVRLTRREWAVRPMLFAAVMVVCIAGTLAARGPGADRTLAVGAAAAFPPLVLTALVVGILARALVRGPGKRPVCGWTAINTLCGYGTFALSCALMPPFSLLLALAGSRRERLLRGGMRRWMRLVYAMTPTVSWSWSGHGSALVGRRVVVSNHESILDILSACALPGTRNLLAKTWVFRAPMLGLAARFAGVRNVDRLDPDDYLVDAERLLGEREGVFVFPEGRRTRDGGIDRFRLGAFALADGARTEVVPVAMAGGGWSIPAGQSWIQPGEVRSVVLEPMRREGDETLRAFAARCRASIATAVHATRCQLLPGAYASLQRRGWLLGLPPRLRRATSSERRTDAIARAIAGACATSDETGGDWLLLGTGWSTAALCLRQMAPAGRLHAVETDGAKLRVSAHAWLRSGDTVASSASADPEIPTGWSGMVCHLPCSDDRVRRLLPRILAAKPVVVVVCEDAAGWTAALAGYSVLRWASGESTSVPAATTSCTRDGIVVLVREPLSPVREGGAAD